MTEGSDLCSDDCIRDALGGSAKRERRDTVRDDGGRGGERIGRVCIEWVDFLDGDAWFMSLIDDVGSEIGRSSCRSSSPATLDPERVPSSTKLWMDARGGCKGASM